MQSTLLRSVANYKGKWGGLGMSERADEPVVVRAIAMSDVDAFRAMRIEALRTCPLSFTADLAETEARTPDAWREQVARALGSGSSVILLADAGARGLVGMAGVFTPPQPKLSHVGTIWGVFVRESLRRRGVGEALIRAAIDWARHKGLVGLRLSSVQGNDGSLRLYERCGFVAYGVEPQAVQWEGKLYDETLLAMRL